MSVTPPDKLRGILPVVISGGRPALSQRLTAKLLSTFHGITADPIWAVIEDDAASYENDGHEVSVYTRKWAEDYAAGHWAWPEPLEPGGFLGAFPGREWACRLAESGGFWAVLQLDDNIAKLTMFRRSYAASRRIAETEGGLGMYADVLGAVALSTNGAMTGAHLSAVPPGTETPVVSRTGFPYSLFIERVGEDREEWYGPFDDDIIHAFQYGGSPASSTALLVPMLNYAKEHSSSTGMRRHYDNGKRAVSLQRLFPHAVRVGVYRKANGRGNPRVYRKMLPGAIRTPMAITDHELYGEVNAYLSGLARRCAELHRENLSSRVAARARRSGGARSGSLA